MSDRLRPLLRLIPSASMARAVRELASGLCAFALLAQMMLATPLALRMAADDMAAFPFAESLCTASVSASASILASSGPGQTDHGLPHPQPGGTHDDCLLCHGHVVPAALLTAMFVPPPAMLSYAVDRPSPMAPSPVARSFDLYASRAPPAAA